jgi:hypothetical protein
MWKVSRSIFDPEVPIMVMVPGSILGMDASYPDLVIFQVLTTASMKMTVFWDVVPCSLVEVYRRIFTRLHGTSQKTVIFN